MLIKLRVHPDSKKNSVTKKAEDHYEVWVKAPAERGLANSAVLELMGEKFRIPAKRLRLVKGAKSPSKIIEVPL